jgi:hypothetical protein
MCLCVCVCVCLLFIYLNLFTNHLKQYDSVNSDEESEEEINSGKEEDQPYALFIYLFIY